MATLPDINFIGDKKIFKCNIRATEKLIDENIPNLRLILFDAESLMKYLILQEINTDNILNFSDPWPKSKHTKKAN